MGKRKTKIINVDFQRLERRGYKSSSGLGKEIIEAMIRQNQPTTEHPTERQIARKELVNTVIDEVLTKGQKEVVELYFGFTGLDPMTDSDIARKLGKAHQTIRQMRTRALVRLKKHMQLNNEALKNIKNTQ